MTSDVFEINDYTDATDFERFVSLIYKCLTDWYKNHYQIIELNLKKDPQQKLVQEEIILNYGIDLYLISYNLIVRDNVSSHSTKSSLSKWFKLKSFVVLKHIRKLNDIGDYQCLPLNISHNQKLLSALSLALQQFYSNYYASHSSGDLDNSILPLYLFTCINEETQIYQGIVQKHCEIFGIRQNLTMFYYSQPLSGLTYKDSLIQLLTLDSRKDEICCVVDYTFNFALIPTRKVLNFDWAFFSDDISLTASEKNGFKRESSILTRYLWAFGSTVFPLERIDLRVTWKDLPVTSTPTHTHQDTDDENNTTDRAPIDDEVNDELRLGKMTNTSRPPSRPQPYFVENERNFNLLEFFDDYYRSYKSSSRRYSEECRSRSPHPQIDFEIEMEFKERRVDERQTVTGILARKLARITQVLDYHHNYYRTNLLMATGAAEEPFLDSREYMKGDHLEASVNQHLQQHQTLHAEDKKANHNFLQDPMSNKNNFERAFDKLTIGHHPSPPTTCTTENENHQSSFKSIQKTGRDFLRTKNPFTSTVSRVPAMPEGGSHKIMTSTSNPMTGNDNVNKVISDNLMDALFWILFPDSKPQPAASDDSNYKKLYQLATPLVDDEINKIELPGKKFKLSPPGSLVDVFSQVVFLLLNMDALNVANPLTNYATRSSTLPESSAIISYDLNDIYPCMLVPLYNNDKSSNQLITDTNFRKLVYDQSISANTQEFHHQRGGGHQQNQMETITRALKEFWREFVLELRYRWDNAIIIPLIDDSKPDYRYSLFYQKLQMLNECIKLKQKQKLKENRPNIPGKMATSNKTYTTGQDEKDEDETFYDCDNFSPSSLSIDNNPQNRLGNDFKRETSCQSSVKPEGRSHILDSNIKLFNNRDYLYVPYTQDPPFMTEDQLHEQQLTILQSVHHSASSDAEFSSKPSHPYHPSRAEMQSMTLKSDMRAFKAANPNSDDLRDFLRWYSPTDLVWISQGDECQLSERMKIGLETYINRANINCEKSDDFPVPLIPPLRKHPDNLWARLWYDNHETSPLPVSRQPRLFNEITNGEKALHDISRLTLPDILTNYSGSVALQIAFYASKVYFSHFLPRGSCDNLEQVTEKKSKTHYDEMEELVRTETSKMAAYLSKMDALANEKYGGFAGSSNEESGGAVGNRPRPFLDRLIYAMDDLENDLATFHCLKRFTETYLPSRPGSGTTYRESFRGADFIGGSDEQQIESQVKQILLRQQRQKSFLDLHEPAPAIKFSVTPSNFVDTKDLMESLPLFGQLVGGDDLMAKSHSKYRQSKFFGWKNEAAGVMNIRSMFTDLEELKKICQNNYPDTATATATTTANDNKGHNLRSSIIPIYENTSTSGSKEITKPLFLCGLLNKEYLFDEIKIAPETPLGNRERKLYVLVGSKEFRIARVEDCL